LCGVLTRTRRDYSQAVDVGTLGRGIKLGTIRILVWVMGFMAHGYATEEFEVITPTKQTPIKEFSMMFPKTDLISLRTLEFHDFTLYLRHILLLIFSLRLRAFWLMLG
jgi:Heterokaryon incompatibility protein Het-C